MSDCHSIGGTWPTREHVFATFIKLKEQWTRWKVTDEQVADALLALFRPMEEENARTIAALRAQLTTVTQERDDVYRVRGVYWRNRFGEKRSDD